MARDVMVRVYDGTSPATLLTTLTTDSERTWREQLDEVGSFSLKIQADDADAGLLFGGNILRFQLNGTTRWAGVCGRPARQTVAKDGATRLLGVRGLGTLALWDRGVVLPELGVGRNSPANRLFNFASSDFDHSAWAPATQIKKQDDTTAGFWEIDGGAAQAPRDWPDPDAWWIWCQPASGGVPPQPVGTTWYWTTFNLAVEKDLKLFITADDGFEVYIDAALVASETKAFMWGETRVSELHLDAGTHTIAIAGINIDRPNTAASNIAGVLCSLIESTEGGAKLGNWIVHTDNSWVCRGYGHVPTMTPREILRVCLTEVQALGADYMPGLTLGATDAADSNSVAWATPVDIGFPVGTSLLSVIRTLCEHAIDVWMDPTNLQLEVYNLGTLGTDKTGTIDLTAGVNFGMDGEGHDGQDSLCNVGLVQYHTGVWTLIDDAGSVVANGARMAYFSLGTAPSDEQADREMTGVFRDHSEANDSVTSAVERRGTGEDPYDDFIVGDTVLMPGMDDLPTDTLVEAITVSEDATGKAKFVVEGRQGATGGS